MGHTIAPMRYVVYDKIGQLQKLCKALREPEHSAAIELLNHVYQHISAITYANPLPHEVENNMIFSMLFREKQKKELEVDNLTLFVFSLMVRYKVNQIKNPDETNIHRLLRTEQPNYAVVKEAEQEYNIRR